jgi:hypothetical protein
LLAPVFQIACFRWAEFKIPRIPKRVMAKPTRTTANLPPVELSARLAKLTTKPKNATRTPTIFITGTSAGHRFEMFALAEKHQGARGEHYSHDIIKHPAARKTRRQRSESGQEQKDTCGLRGIGSHFAELLA